MRLSKRWCEWIRSYECELRRKSQCKTKIKLDLGDNVIEQLNEHTHPPSQVRVELTKVKSRIKDTAETLGEPPQRIIANELATQQTFQRQFDVVFRLIWRRNVAQRQINVEATLCTSTLKFTTWNNIETTFCFSTLIWTTLDNVKTALSFSTSIFTQLGNFETTFRIWPFEKKN